MIELSCEKSITIDKSRVNKACKKMKTNLNIKFLFLANYVKLETFQIKISNNYFAYIRKYARCSNFNY